MPYDKLHYYIADSLVEWYYRFKPDAAGTEDDEGAAEEDINGENVLVETDGGPEASSLPFSLNRKSLGRRRLGRAPAGALPQLPPAAPALPQLQRQHSIECY